MTLSSRMTGKLNFTYSSSVGGANVLYQPIIDLDDTMGTGVIVDTADLLYVSQATALTGSATVNLDVAGALTDAFGTTLTFVKIKWFYFRNLSTTVGNTITIGGHDTAAFLLFGTAAHTHTVGPNGDILIREPSLAGKAVTATTGDLLKILNNTENAVTYDIVIAGTSS